jgi:Protein of unknown function/Domain of unknown function (DUF1835)
MIHIVFNEADIAVLNQAITLDATLTGEVLQVKDDYAVGPIVNIYAAEGIATRKAWWCEVLAGGDYDGKVESGEIDDPKLLPELTDRLKQNEEEIIWIWAAPNKHDISGYYWLMSHLKEFQGRIFILYLNNLPFFNEKGSIFYPEWLSAIPAKEFLKAKKLARAITLSEFEVEPDEWLRICNENKGIRLLEGGKKLSQQDYDFYDPEIKKYITGDWQKASKVIHQFLNKAKHTTGDAYILWRLKLMITDGQFDMQGVMKNMKDFEVKAPAAIAP